MSVLVAMHPAFAAHLDGVRHPERPTRLAAVLAGIDESPARDAVAPFSPEPVTDEDLARVHTTQFVETLRRFCDDGGGRIGVDTVAMPESWAAATLAAGAGLDAIDRLERDEADAAFLAVRPPGHHARPTQAMGFCLLNSVAVAAASLAARGERVLIVDWDAHHGNGTQEVFYDDGRVVYVSLHQWPLYPGTGRLEERGSGEGTGATVNIPLPPGSDGDAFRAAIDDIVVPLAERVRPTWVLQSAGFDAHRDDPLTDMGLTAGDYADIAGRIAALAPPGRRMAFLEGGYDLDALRLGAGACVAALAGEVWRPEPPSSSGAGRSAVAVAREQLERLAPPPIPSGG